MSTSVTSLATGAGPRTGPPAARRPWRTPVVSAGVAVVGAVTLLARDPHVAGSYGVCPVHALTGGYCPGCGSLRACEDLLTGHVGAAFGSNLLVPFSLGWLVWWWVARVSDAMGRDVRREPSGRVFCWALLVVLAMFTLARNLPGSPLAP